jgi:hypothetical protein
MIDLVEAIRIAMEPDATVEARAAGASACRSILATLETPIQSSERPAFNPAQIAGLVTALRGVPADQLLDLAIARLRAALPAGTAVPQSQPLKLQLIPMALAARKTP